MDCISPRANTIESASEAGLTNRFFWPVMAAIAIVSAMGNYSRVGRLTFPPHIICLFVYVAFAGASVLWAFSPGISLIRYVQQVMVLTAIILPTMLAVRTADLMRGLFLCFGLAAILNIFFIPGNSETIVDQLNGYPGYFEGKNYLGEFSAIACLLALHETSYPGPRRALGIVVLFVTALLLYLANSKTSIGLVFLAPILAGLTLITRKMTRISPAIPLLSIVVCYFVLARISGFNSNRLSYMLYGDSTFTGRTIIWDFASEMIDLRPLLGWGYQSFWWVGPGGPSIGAPGFVKNMPNAHNGYYDTMLEMGYVGYALLLIFILATLHAIGRMADRDPARARLVLSLALYIILHNFLESIWMRGFEFLWVVFVIVAAEIGRYWQPLPKEAPYRSRMGRPSAPGRARFMHENDRK